MPSANEALAARYRFDAANYIFDKLGWTPWEGSEEHERPGQIEVIRAYELALRQQHERDAYEAGSIGASELQHWQPGQTIQNWIRVEAGHGVGKTKLSSGIVNHFFDCFAPSIIYTFAPTWTQIHDLLWKEIKIDRRGKGLPGRVLDLELRIADDHFAIGRATSDAGGRGTERVQGQHGTYLLFVIDEAEGVPDFVWNAIESMASGGICIVLMLANPRTRSSRFHKQKDRMKVRSFRISCIGHPNVLQGWEVVPGAVRRQYVESMIEGDGGDEGGNCEVVEVHDPDEHTFELPFSVTVHGQELKPGTIFKPNAEYMFRVLGVPPANSSVNTFVPVGRYEAATKREADPNEDGSTIRAGVDVSRFGDDYGTLYIRHKGRIWRAKQFWKADTSAYVGPIKDALLNICNDAPDDAKPNSCHIRVDGTGGFGVGVIDSLKNDIDLKRCFADFQLLEVNFGEAPHDVKKYANRVTEMYAQSAETIKGISIMKPPSSLEADLCERTYEWVNVSGVAVKKLTDKEKFRKAFNRSPDDGDGFVLCAAPDFIFPKKRVLKYA